MWVLPAFHLKMAAMTHCKNALYDQCVVLAGKEDKIKIKTVYCHVASTWNLHAVAYIILTFDTQGKFMDKNR